MISSYAVSNSDMMMMPKRLGEFDFDFSFNNEASMDAIDYYSLGYAPDDDIWKKFDAKCIPDFSLVHSDFSLVHYEETESDEVYNSAGWKTLPTSVSREIRNHDCMWTGHCLSKEHSSTHSPSPFIPVVPQIQPVQPKVNSVLKPVIVPKSVPSNPSPLKTVICQNSDKKKGDILCNILTNNNKRTGVIVQKTVGRSLLLNSRTTQNVATTPAVTVKQEFPVVKQEPVVRQELSVVVKQELPVVVKQEFPIVFKQEYPPHRQCLESNDSPRPLTPQSLSDDDPHSDHNDSVFRNALDVMLSQTAENDDWDEELLLNFGTNRTKVTREIKSEPVEVKCEENRVGAVAHFDHNYDVTNKQTVVKIEGLGVETPSDSEEEEIDVVTLTERSTPSSRSSSISSSSGFSLPNNPSIEDQEEIQVLTTSKLLSASRAVSKKLKSSSRKSFSPKEYYYLSKKPSKRQRQDSESCDDDDYVDYSTMVYQPSKKARVGSGKKGRSKFSDNEPDSRERRSLHNNMERMRRIDLRNSFEELRVLVPSLVQKERAAKVVILKDAAAYCCDLGTQSRLMSMQVAALRREQLRLRGVVSGLRKAAAVVVQKGKKCVKSKEKVEYSP